MRRCFAVFIVQDFEKTIENERKNLQNTSSAFAAASSDPLASGDTGALYAVLRGISDVENSTLISVSNMDRKVIAEIGSSINLAGRDGLAEGKGLWHLAMANSLVVVSPVWHSGVQIGNLTLHSDTSWLRRQYVDDLVTLVLVALLCAILIALVTNRVISKMLKPLHEMSKSLALMGDRPDLSARFSSKAADEIGVLSGAFNKAFETIQQRDAAINRHLVTLEDTVQERTIELEIAAKDAKAANAAKSEFLATMSHEIRTPMNGMLVMAELLAASDLSVRQQRFAEVISRSGTSLLNIINDILDMSKIEAGKLDLESVPLFV
ncbi:MAG: histidine kinase dimerization/phospho-acceptor domain-containing protein [Ahrensia sp.]|nr:histidine kinase dimerization/phospho-acceptor domain-containing protein [Ahrensia sp.]